MSEKNKQGLMVFFVHTGNVSPSKSNDTLNQIRNIFFSGDIYKDLIENYDLFFMTLEYGDNKIEVFPYNDYKLSIQNMTVGEIEAYVANEVLSKLQKP